ncbi:hypothetical protein [Streptomyces olivochromogenes]|uniref:hypothetical protein n=1 Tax=Streptomyces olivochromogenes TaxID=1963 RepID=UPI0007479C87|nr:hypothetical protein [Streptomyces olivochromogenes]KUN48993.1 hypothetical protein AQJ27_04955 [Streptomyces olivochromogenes]
MTGVAGYRVHPFQERELRDRGENEDVLVVGVGAERAARVDDHLLQPVGPFTHGCQAPAQEARPHIGVGGAERYEDAGTRVVESVLGEVGSGGTVHA